MIQQLTISLLGFVLSFSASPGDLSASQALAAWQPSIGDQLIIDTKNNVGYLLHPSGTNLSFKLVSGQRRTVNYIGLTYNAATPEKDWIAKSHHVKGDRITYGPSGRFIRLYENGDIYTHYGIHTHAYGDEYLASDNRYRSMGCIIVSEDIFDLIERTYLLSGKYLRVATREGIGPSKIALAK